MNSKVEPVAFSDRERALIQRVADERGVTFEEAAEALVHEGIAARFRRHTGRQPAQVYPIKKAN